MLKSTLIDMRMRFRRTLAIVVAVVLGVAFFTATLLSSSVFEQTLRGSVGNQLRGADIIIVSENSQLDASVADSAMDVEGVRDTEMLVTQYGETKVGGGTFFFAFGPVPELTEVRDAVPLEEGRLPTSPDEVAITEAARSLSGVDIGESLTWAATGEPGGNLDGTDFTVVGIVRGGNSFGTNLTEVFVAPDQFGQIAESPQVSGVIVQVRNDAEIEAVQRALGGVIPAGAVALTFDQLVDAEVERMQDGSNAMLLGLVGFAVIALFAAGIVISNTFSITVAQRTRELALLRCIGADARQVHRSVMIEAVLLGVGASVIGVFVGYAAIVGGSAMFIGSVDASAVVDAAWKLALPVVLGLLLTVGAAVGPARAATRVHPLQALRQSDAPAETATTSWLRIALTGVMVVGGGAVMVAAMLMSLSMENESPYLPLLIGMVGGAVSFLGLLYGSSLYIPPVTALIGGALESIVGSSAKVAASNTRRNPRRTASTAMALMMGVTLIAMMTTGASSVQATWNDVVDVQAPVDLDIRHDQGAAEQDVVEPLPDHVERLVQNTEGVTDVAQIREQGVELDTPNLPESLSVTAVGIDPVAGQRVARSEAMDPLEPGVIVVPERLALDSGILDGDQVKLTQGPESTELTARVVEITDYEVYIAPQDLDTLRTNAPTTGMWVRLDDDASAQDVVSEITEGIPEGESVSIGGSAHDRATFLDLVDQILLITTAMLGVAVVIAIVGVGNTLTLSVLERTRETGMLRAMGMTTSQIRVSLALEGVVIALIGGIIGLVAGAVYGWVGATTLFGSTWDVALGFPVGRLALILAIAVLSGLLASILPARRAVSVSPVAAITTV